MGRKRERQRAEELALKTERETAQELSRIAMKVANGQSLSNKERKTAKYLAQQGGGALAKAPQNGAASAPQPRHMTPCACHCAECRAAGHRACIVLGIGLHDLFHGNADVADLVLRHYYRAYGWEGSRRSQYDEHHEATFCACVQFGPTGDVIAAGGGAGRPMHIICAHTGVNISRPLRCHSASAAGVRAVAWSPCERWLAAGESGESKRVTILDAQTFEVKMALRCDYEVFCLSYGPTGDILAVGTSGGNIHFFNAQGSENALSPVKGHAGNVNGVAFHPTKNILASCAYKSIKVWNADTGENLWTVPNWKGHLHAVNSVSWAPDGKRLVSGSDDGTIKIWGKRLASGSAATGECLWTLQLRTGAFVTSVSWAPDGANIVAGLRYSGLLRVRYGLLRVEYGLLRVECVLLWVGYGFNTGYCGLNTG